MFSNTCPHYWFDIPISMTGETWSSINTCAGRRVTSVPTSDIRPGIHLERYHLKLKELHQQVTYLLIFIIDDSNKEHNNTYSITHKHRRDIIISMIASRAYLQQRPHSQRSDRREKRIRTGVKRNSLWQRWRWWKPRLGACGQRLWRLTSMWLVGEALLTYDDVVLNISLVECHWTGH